MATMKQARRDFANRTHVIRTVHDKNGAGVDVKVRKRNPKGDNFRTWASANVFGDVSPKLAQIIKAA